MTLAAVSMPMTCALVLASGPPESPGTDRGVGLDQAGQPLRVGAVGVARGDRLAERGDVAGRDGGGAAETAGVAESDDRVADADLVGVAPG